MTATARSQAPERGHGRAVRFALLATPAQIDYILKLGGKPKPDLTNGEANQYIRALKRKSNIAYHRQVRERVEARAAERREAAREAALA